MTIKEVLDRFAQEKLVIYPLPQVTHFWLLPAQQGVRIIRTAKEKFCPLQVVTPLGESYIDYAMSNGLCNGEVHDIMRWADRGIWPTHAGSRGTKEDPRYVANS